MQLKRHAMQQATNAVFSYPECSFLLTLLGHEYASLRLLLHHLRWWPRLRHVRGWKNMKLTIITYPVSLRWSAVRGW